MDRTSEISTEKALVVVETSKLLSIAAEELVGQLDDEDQISDEEVSTLKEHLKHHEKMRDQMRDRIAHIEMRLRKNAKVDEAYNEVHFEQANLIGLQAVLREAQAELHAILRAEMDAEDEANGDEDNVQEERDPSEGQHDEEVIDVEEEQEDDEDQIYTSRNIKRVCKTLFAKIAAKTHPDKTKDAELIELFSVARAYYKAYNLPGLKEIWEAVQGGVSKFKASKLRKLRDKLRQELSYVIAELEAMMASSRADLIKIFHFAGEQYAMVEYINMLKRTLQHLGNEREQTLAALQHVRAEIKKRKEKNNDGA